ncbi:MAG: BamA/TamA family outer membrane protein, partial [Leptospiraceae bacterium]|nr:BamA/TamA family outer membrane protein [Leptospiraceae bacterium]
SFFDGIMRAVFGTRLSKANVKPYDGQIFEAKDPYYGNTDIAFMNVNVPTVQGTTKLTEDAEAKKISGYNGGYINLLRFGLVYDTRDFEPDPNKGVFAEVTHERAEKAIGSDFQYNKMFYSVRVFYSPFPKVFEKFVLAGKLSFVNTKGNAPFFEYRNMWGTETNISGLGGRTTLRGYMQDRFVGPAMGFGNLEVRWKFYEVPGFAFNLVPFFDFGRVWDRAENASLKDYKYSAGVGLRIAWNQSTIIYVDVASSRENSGQVYMNFNHIF